MQCYNLVKSIKYYAIGVGESNAEYPKTEITTSEDILCFHIDHAVLMIQKEKELKLDANLTYSLIEE